MEFTDGLVRHLFPTGYAPSLLILDFQLSLYLRLWTKTCKTLHQNQNCKPFQTVLKISTVLLDRPLQQTLRWQREVRDHPHKTVTSLLTFQKPTWNLLQFFFSMSETISKYYVSSFSETKNWLVLQGAKFLLIQRTGNSYCIISFFSADLQMGTGVLAGPRLAQVWTELRLLGLIWPNKGTLNSTSIWSV